MIGANGLTQDSTACISVTHNMRLKVHLTQVITAARAAGISMRADGTIPVFSSQVAISIRKAVSQHAIRLGQSTRCPGRTIWCKGWTSQLVTRRTARSEEHTSELQSLMRISYAVFCLKKKKKIKTT